jgi:hypothetical protein
MMKKLRVRGEGKWFKKCNTSYFGCCIIIEGKGKVEMSSKDWRCNDIFGNIRGYLSCI